MNENKNKTWKQIFSESVTSLPQLCELLELNVADFNHIAMQTEFPLRVPRGFVARMQKGNLQDPLLLQVLSQARENEVVPGYAKDPLEESKTNPIPGLLHKYKGRVLLTLSTGCAVHCRYCFRRHFPYHENTIGTKGWSRITQYIQADDSIEEVILSGGDPLLISDHLLKSFLHEVEKIPHVSRLRIHTRFPIVIPERMTEELQQLLTNTRLQTIMIVHCNHANEIDDTVRQAFSSLRNTSVTLLNQSVLLKGVNDSVNDLVQLSKALFEIGILPCYLHLLDKVAGSAHFEVSHEEACVLYKGLLQNLSGYLVPKLVREVPGFPYKKPIVFE